MSDVITFFMAFSSIFLVVGFLFFKEFTWRVMDYFDDKLIHKAFLDECRNYLTWSDTVIHAPNRLLPLANINSKEMV